MINLRKKQKKQISIKKKIIFSIIGIPIILFILFIGLLTIPIGVDFKFSNNAIRTPENLNNLKVLNWNIQHLGGNQWFYYVKGNKSQPSCKRVEKNINHILDTIKTQNPDIIFFQEYPYKSKWSCYKNLNTELEQLGYLSQAYKTRYRRLYSPFPTSDPVKQINDGYIVFSKYKMDNADYLILDKPNLTQKILYPEDILLNIKYTINNQSLCIYNSHLTAFSAEANEMQFNQLIKEMNTNTECDHSVFAGDLNFINHKAQIPNDIKTEILYEPNRLTKYKDQYTLQNPDTATFCWPGQTIPSLKLDYVFATNQTNIDTEILNKSCIYADHTPIIINLTF